MSAQVNFLDMLTTAPAATPGPVAPSPVPTDRHFYRCPDCLSVIAADLPKAPRPGGVVHWSAVPRVPSMACAACDATLEPMGKVDAGRLTLQTERTPCDDRCTTARGPKCECGCLGENHGVGLVSVIGYRDNGKAPTLRPVNLERARVEGQAWRDLCGDVVESIHARYPEIKRKADGQWIESFGRYLEGRRRLDAYRAVRAGRTTARVAAMRKLLETT